MIEVAVEESWRGSPAHILVLSLLVGLWVAAIGWFMTRGGPHE